MATVIRAEISEKNKYWISKHRHYELKHYCMQYPTWKKLYNEILECGVPVSKTNDLVSNCNINDPTARNAIARAYYGNKIKAIEDLAKQADPYLHIYILRAVTEGLSYTTLKYKMGIPCGRDMYYDRYRRFFWLLSQHRD